MIVHPSSTSQVSLSLSFNKPVSIVNYSFTTFRVRSLPGFQLLQ
jgi:hypothetical protein